MTTRIEGTVADGYESVRAAFQDTVQPGEESADCCVYLDGECIVDIRAGRSPDDIQCVFSVTKGVVAGCVNLLIERGMIDLDAPVAQYWPEFGTHGKGAMPVRWLLEHRSGVLAPDTTLSIAEVSDWDAVCGALADARPAWEPGSTYGYHAQSFGWLVGELIRRVDGRNLADFLAEEVAKPAEAEIFIGLPLAAQHRLIDVTPAMPVPSDAEGAPGHGGRDEADEPDMSQFVGPYTQLAMTLNGALIDDAFAVPHDRKLRALPIAASNGYSNAPNLARFYAWLLTAFSARTLRDLTIPRTEGPDAVLTAPAMKIEQHFSRGFEVMQPNPADPGSTAFGHNGLGGSIAFADPARRLAFAYTTASARLGAPGADARANRLARAVYSCLEP